MQISPPPKLEGLRRRARTQETSLSHSGWDSTRPKPEGGKGGQWIQFLPTKLTPPRPEPYGAPTGLPHGKAPGLVKELEGHGPINPCEKGESPNCNNELKGDNGHNNDDRATIPTVSSNDTVSYRSKDPFNDEIKHGSHDGMAPFVLIVLGGGMFWRPMYLFLAVLWGAALRAGLRGCLTFLMSCKMCLGIMAGVGRAWWILTRKRNFLFVLAWCLAGQPACTSMHRAK